MLRSSIPSALLLLSLCAIALAADHAVNGGCEAKDISAWTVKGDGIALVRDTAVRRNGAASLRVDGKGKEVVVSQQFKGLGGKTLRVSADVQLAGAEGSHVFALLFDPSGSQWRKLDWKVVSGLKAADGWQSVSADLDLPAEAGVALVGVFCTRAETVWIDDFSVMVKP